MEPFGGEPTPAAPPPTTTTTTRAAVLEHLRALRRPQPRAGIALAAGGCALIVLGTLLVGGDSLGGDNGDTGSQVPGALLSLAVVVGGLVVLAKLREGPVATAGSVAAAFGVPPLLFFLSFDESSLPPYSTELILYGSTVVWLVLWLIGPAQARSVFLGGAALGFWASALQATEGLFTSPFDALSTAFGSFDGTDFGGGGFDPPDPATMGALSLVIGLAYLFIARSWDRKGRHGAATPVFVAALVVLPFAVSFLGDELNGIGAGLLGVVVGGLVAALGASSGRRATTWLGAAGAALGFVAIVFDLFDEPTPAGIGLIVVGALVVLGSEAGRNAVDEPDELVPGPSTIGPFTAVGTTGDVVAPVQEF
jgi:hypothetical protein